MDEVLKSLRHLGIKANILLLILGLIAIFYLYKTTLETQKLHLEIRKLKQEPQA